MIYSCHIEVVLPLQIYLWFTNTTEFLTPLNPLVIATQWMIWQAAYCKCLYQKYFRMKFIVNVFMYTAAWEQYIFWFCTSEGVSEQQSMTMELPSCTTTKSEIIQSETVSNIANNQLEEPKHHSIFCSIFGVYCPLGILEGMQWPINYIWTQSLRFCWQFRWK